MALVYFDTSALVRLCLPQTGTPLATMLWNRADAVVTSALADAEVRATLAAARNQRLLTLDECRAARHRWSGLAGGLRLVGVGEAVLASAARLVEDAAAGPLRAADAVHVASALLLRHDDTLVAAWDERVAAGARSQGLRVLP